MKLPKLDPITIDVLRSVVIAIAIVFIVVVLSTMGGCDATQPVRPTPVAIQVKTVDAPRVIPVPCVDAAEIPPPSETVMPPRGSDGVRKSAGAYVDMRKLATENEVLRGLLTKCTRLEGQP